MDNMITDFIDAVSVFEEKNTKYYTLRFENVFSHKRYFFRVSKELVKFAIEHAKVLDDTIILEPVDVEEKKYMGDVI